MDQLPSQPIIYETGKKSFPPISGNFWQTKGLKLVFLILGLVIIVELYNGYQILRRSSTINPPSVIHLHPISPGKLSLIPNKPEYHVGETVSITIEEFTGGHPTDGTDVIIQYDPNILEATGEALFNKGNIYPEYPVASSHSNSGLIQISGVINLSSPGFNGAGIFGILNLKAKSAGATSLKIVFSPDKTTESNIVESETSKNVLGETANADLIIK